MAYIGRRLQIPNLNFGSTRSSSKNETVRVELSTGNSIFIENPDNFSLGEDIGKRPGLVVAGGEDKVLSRVEGERGDRVVVNFEF